MRLIAWLLTLAFGLSGIALYAQGEMAFAVQAGVGLLLLAILTCPLVWAPDTGLLSFLFPTRKFRTMSGIALVLSAPLLLPWPF